MAVFELWGGPECTVARVGDRWVDQFARTGHLGRPGDIEAFASLGLKALRYPISWERTARRGPDDLDWSLPDERLPLIRAAGMRPIAGLVHHGSGAPHAPLLSGGFARGLAAFAAQAARRYPWIEDWTPVNEPLTTARFSALYGHWHPHRRDEGAFFAALLDEIDGTRLAMREIRRIVPNARLVQTEDLGRIGSTAPIARQAEFENHRRWLTWDLLEGRVVPGHALFHRIARHGCGDRLRAIADDPCPPDVIGINHYLTSDRFLDHRLERYPRRVHGGNGIDRYADVEAVRVPGAEVGGMQARLAEAWERYGRPVAITECHLGCTRDEQMRWFEESWTACERSSARGARVEALTVWALLGAYDWDSLLTLDRGRYEPGPFDVSSGTLRPTALARAVQARAAARAPEPVATAGGWWTRPVRYEYRRVKPTEPGQPAAPALRGRASGPPLLIAGASGTLGRALARACALRNLRYVLTDRTAMTIDDRASVEAAIRRIEPWAVVNAAGWVRVDDAEERPDDCFRSNTVGARVLAEASADRGLPFLTFSSDLVFCGQEDKPYVESRPTAPLNVYGRSKAEAEREVLAVHDDALVVRTAAFFSAHDPYNFAHAAKSQLEAGRVFTAARDQVISPTYVPHLAHAALDLLIDRERGLWHLANQGAMSWAEFARAVAETLDLDPGLVEAVDGEALGFRAPRPAAVPLDSERGRILPGVDRALEAYAEALRKAA